ncbi:MAG TPA: putative cytokinetic ring protein SteA [Acidimicrobiales bacterium]|nr:putative cytokinetic ring protein SteA [Acidimicrobiales bacterium]
MAAPLDDRPTGDSRDEGRPTLPEPLASAGEGRPLRRIGRPSRRRRQATNAGPVTGVARIDRRTKRLVKRLQHGDVAVIHHEDLDRVAAETLVDAGPVAVVNAAPSISGRYPNVGPLLLCQAGIPLLDDVGPEVMEALHEGAPVTVDGDRLLVGTEVVATGTRQTVDTVDAAIDVARANMGAELERFAVNTIEYVHQEIELLTGELDAPELRVPMAGRQVLIVVRGIDYREDLSLLQQSGYVRDVRPVTIGVDGGADALLELGTVPDIIIGDFDSVSERALRCGAQLIVHGYTDGRAPGAKRLDDLGLDYTVFSAPGTSEDVAMLLSYQEGAELMVAVGTHNSMVEFLDKGRAGMASTFLVRMKVGAKLVDAKGVSRLYRTSVRTGDLLWMILAAVFTLAVALMLSEPVRLVLRAFWRSLLSG